MIVLGGKPGADGDDLIEIAFPRYARKVKGSAKDAAPLMPVVRIEAPRTASWQAAQSAAWRSVPARDEGESDEDFTARAAAKFKSIGLVMLVDKLGFDAAIAGVVRELSVYYLALALIRDWTGIVDEAGEPVEPDAESIKALMQVPDIATRFEREVEARLGPVISEGNV